MHNAEILASANLTICALCMLACICRLNHMTADVPRKVRAYFVAILVGAMASGLQPVLFSQWPGIGQTVFSGCVLFSLLMSMPRWWKGLPGDLVKEK